MYMQLALKPTCSSYIYFVMRIVKGFQVNFSELHLNRHKCPISLGFSISWCVIVEIKMRAMSSLCICFLKVIFDETVIFQYLLRYALNVEKIIAQVALLKSTRRGHWNSTEQLFCRYDILECSACSVFIKCFNRKTYKTCLII